MSIWQDIDPNWVNPGDLLIAEGVRKLGINTELAVAGTPLIFDRCVESNKYKKMMEECRKYDRKVALGVGACLPDGMSGSQFVDSNPEFGNSWLSMGFERITARDPLAQWIFAQFGVRSSLEVCPSRFAIDEDNLKTPIPGSILAIPATSWHPHEQWNSLGRIDGETARVEYSSGQWTIEQALEQIYFFSMFETIVSQRIHAVIPLAKYRKTYIDPVDSRFSAALLAGSQILTKSTKL